MRVLATVLARRAPVVPTVGRPGLEEQAKGPFLDPLEMHVPTKQAVASRLSGAAYAADREAVFGPDSLSFKNVDASYDRIAAALAAHERTDELSPFSAKGHRPLLQHERRRGCG